MTAAKKHPTKAAAVRHHNDLPCHPAEVDINLNSKCSDPELKVLLKLLRPLLREVIKASKRCKHHHHHQGQKFVSHYHNITACDGRH
jgi:hypothetical protein